MKAVVLENSNQLSWCDVAQPRAGDGESLIRVTHSGVCGTDLKIYQGGIPVQHPLIMGHEMVGEVVESFAKNEFSSGSRVIVNPVLFCGDCYQCRAGQSHICPNSGILGREFDGGFAEYVVAPNVNVHSVSKELDDVEVPLIQVLTTCVHAQRLTDIFPGEAVVVMGLGVAGQLHAQLVKGRGAGPVIGISRSAWKRDLAIQMGADYVFDPNDNVEQKVRELTEGRGADLVIEAAGHVPVLAQAMELTRIGGRIMGFGIYTAPQGELPFYQFYFKEINFINARAAKAEDFPASMELVRNGTVKLQPLLSHTFRLRELEKALEFLTVPDVERMKVILEH